MKQIIKRARCPLGIALGVFLLFRFVLYFGYVPSRSMEPTIPAGSIIIGIRLFDRNELETGDIIIFYHEEKTLIKRIGAKSGDVVHVDGQKMVVPYGAYYVLGDQSECSIDSRHWPVPWLDRHAIIARLVLHFPLKR